VKIEVKKVRPIECGAFEAVEVLVGSVLNSSIRAFFEEFNGGEPVLNFFDVGDVNGSGVNQFVPIEAIASELERFEFRDGFTPIAWAEGGNYVAVDLVGGGVYFVDHEILDGYIKLSEGIDMFLASLRPSSNDDVVLMPEQVKKAWINPKFLSGLKDKK